MLANLLVDQIKADQGLVNREGVYLLETCSEILKKSWLLLIRKQVKNITDAPTLTFDLPRSSTSTQSER